MKKSKNSTILIAVLIVILGAIVSFLLVFSALDNDSSPFSNAKEALAEEFSGAYPKEHKQDGRVVEVDIVASMGQLEIVKGHSTSVWSYNGTVPGPEIRVRKGDTVRINFTNNLWQPSTIHFHGIRVPNRMDGVPDITQLTVRRGESFVYEFTPKDAGTFWFHPHENSSEQLERGLYGVLIVEDEYSEQYSQDRVWVIDDWLLEDTYQIDPYFVTQHDLAHDGRWGNVITVNSSLQEVLRAQPGERIRLRVINVSNGRVYTTNFGSLDAKVIAVDGMYVKEAFHANGFVLAPGNRIDVDITIPKNAAGKSFDVYDEFTRYRNILGTVVVEGNSVATPSFPYPQNEQVPGWTDAVDVPVDKRYVLDARNSGTGLEWTINGETFSEHTPLVLQSGEFNKIAFENKSFRLHPMHLHGQFFKVIARNGRPVKEPYFRDTVLVGAQETVEVGLVPLDKGKWLNHCHIAEHADAGMTTSIIVR